MNSYTISGFTFRTFALVSALAVLGASPAIADETPRSVRVSYADLDISTPAGAATLYGRIRTAAKQVCGYDGSSYTDKAIWNACFKHAVRDAVAKVNNPQLTAVSQGKSPVVTAMLGH